MSIPTAQQRANWRAEAVVDIDAFGLNHPAHVGGQRILALLDIIEAERREWEEWSNELALLIPDGDEGKYSNPEGAQESIILDCFKAYRAQLDQVRAARDEGIGRRSPSYAGVSNYVLVSELDEALGGGSDD